MGLDIILSSDLELRLLPADPERYQQYLQQTLSPKYMLSRTFCYLMGQKNELNQIGRITGTDLVPLYQMEQYFSEYSLQDYLNSLDSEEKKEKVRESATATNQTIEGNIDRVLQTINLLIERLEPIGNLYSLLVLPKDDLLNSKVYFSNFRFDTSNGTLGKNFGEDLRTIRSRIEYEKSFGATTVWFDYS